MKFAARGSATVRRPAAAGTSGGPAATGSNREEPNSLPSQTPTARSTRANKSGSGRSSPGRPSITNFAKGEQIFGPGHGAGFVYIVRSGFVRLYKTLPNGRCINLGLLGPHTVFTQEDQVDAIATGAVAVALVDTTLAIVEEDDLVSMIAQSPGLATGIVHGMTRRLTELQTLVEHLLVRDVGVRLMTTLISLARGFGRPTVNGMTAITLSLSHQGLANMIGSNRVTVTRKLLELQDAGLVGSLGRNTIAINLEEARAFVRAVGAAE